MFRMLVYPLSFCAICYGIWLVLTANQWGDERTKAKDWLSAEARLVDSDIGIRFNMLNPISYPRILFAQPSITYTYKITGKKYEHETRLPPILTPVRISVARKIPEVKQPDPSEIKDIDFAQNIRYNPRTGKPEIQNFDELMADSWDQYYPKVSIKYDPADPNQSITDPDMFMGQQTLLWSGIGCFVIAITLVLAMKFHEWVTKPSENEFDLPGAASRRF